MTTIDDPTAGESIEIDLKEPALAAFLAWLIPGAGHLYQGRTAKGVLLMVCILGTFLFGMWLGDGRVVYAQITDYDVRYPYLCQLPAGLPALPALVRAAREDPRERQRRNETETQMAHEWKEKRLAEYRQQNRVYAPPTSIELDDLQNRLHHYFELGTVFTMIAGLLNILAIYDAWGGPVIIVPREKKRRVAQTDQSPSEPPPSPTKTVEEAASGG